MMAGKFGRIVNITLAAAKAPIDILGLSNGARDGSAMAGHLDSALLRLTLVRREQGRTPFRPMRLPSPQHR